MLTRNTTSMSPVLSSIRQCFNCSNTVATIRESRRILTKMHDIFRQSFGNEALFFYASFPACRYIKICKNQKYYLTYLRNSEKSCNFAPAKLQMPSRWALQRKKVSTYWNIKKQRLLRFVLGSFESGKFNNYCQGNATMNARWCMNVHTPLWVYCIYTRRALVAIPQ